MKKFISLFIVISLVLVCLASCDLFPEEKAEKEKTKINIFHFKHHYYYKVDEWGHRKVYDCGCPNLWGWSVEHVDNKLKDNICDYCGYPMRSYYPY